MGWRRQFETREKRINELRVLLKQKLNSGRDYFIQELVNDTDIPEVPLKGTFMNILMKK